jgi:hypothetical protein
MTALRTILRIFVLILIAPAVALGQPAPDDGYCDYVQGTASATAATLFAPQLFGQFGYIEQLNQVTNDPNAEPNDLRAIGGLRYSFTNIFAGKATVARADADCRRHKAQVAMQAITQQIKDTSSARAIAARLAVYEQAQGDADKMLATIKADVDARRLTTQEAISTQLRVDEIRAQIAQAKRDLAALPSSDTKGVDQLLADYREADAAMEKAEGKLRSIKAYDVNVRAGVDRFLNGDIEDKTRYFAVLEVGVNLGALWTGSGNRRSATGRDRYARTVGPMQIIADPAVLRPLLEVQQKRLVQVQALSSDLDKQLAALNGAESSDAKRFRETIWFEAIKARAELAYLQAHVATLNEMLGTPTK